jgi:hypothetical protein
MCALILVVFKYCCMYLFSSRFIYFPKRGRDTLIVHKVLIRMCMENVVKDISLISDDPSTYEDLLVSRLY